MIPRSPCLPTPAWRGERSKRSAFALRATADQPERFPTSGNGRTMRRMNRATTALIALLAAAVPAAAHHGFGTFDLSKTVSYPGAKLTKLDLINPHSWLYFETKDATGKVIKHRCEMRSVHTLRRSG